MEDMRKEVTRIRDQIKDSLDKPDDAAARRLNTEVQALEDDLQMNKNKFAIEDRIKRIIAILQGEAEHAQIMDHAHLQMFEGKFEHLQGRARSL